MAVGNLELKDFCSSIRKPVGLIETECMDVYVSSYYLLYINMIQLYPSKGPNGNLFFSPKNVPNLTQNLQPFFFPSAITPPLPVGLDQGFSLDLRLSSLDLQLSALQPPGQMEVGWVLCFPPPQMEV